MWAIFRFCCGKDNQATTTRNSSNNVPLPTKKKQKQPENNLKRSGKKPKQQPVASTPQQTATDIRQSSKIAKKDRYEGEQLDGVPHGNGSMLYANGDFFRGQWVNGKKQGRGLQIYQDEGVQYDGQWQNDKPHGKGKLMYPNNSKYEGEFKNGIKDGHGKYFQAGEKKQYEQDYESGKLIKRKQVELHRSKEQEFPTLALDKQRFNTEDLVQFQKQNPQIKELDLFLLLKYYGLTKLTKLAFATKDIKEWTIKEVIDFLDAVGLKDYKQVFYKNKIKGKDMVTLDEKELKEDLYMKMGDRKRFLNYMVFLSDNEPTQAHKSLKKKKVQDGKKAALKFGSNKSMKRILDNFKSKPIYEESIKEEGSYSSSSSDRDKGKNKNKEKQKLENECQEREYGSVAQYYEPRKSSKQRYSLEDKMSSESEKSAKRISNHRKDSKDNKDESLNLINHNNNQFQPLIKKQSGNKLEFNDKGGNTEEAKIDLNKKSAKKSSSSSSSSSASSTPKQLARKKTQARAHQNTQIRQLYQFLKDHRTLQFLIKEKDLQKLQLIGEGGYGKVYKGKYIGQQIAIKDYMKTGKHRHKQDFMKEVMIISDLKHPNIVLYMGICITADKFILVTQYLQNGSLFDQLHKKHKKFTEVEKIQIAYQIVKGMVYLHNMKNLLHRDLKSSNVLIGEDWNVVKLCDFGLSGQKKKRTKHTRVGTYQWMAPQVVRNEKNVDQKSDVYSFGVILWELLTEKIPYEGLTENQIIGLVGYDEEHQLQQPKNCCRFLKLIMWKCLKRQSQSRPTFMQLQDEFEDYLRRQLQSDSTKVNYYL